MNYRQRMFEEVQNHCMSLSKNLKEGESLNKLTKAKEKRVARLVKYWARARK